MEAAGTGGPNLEPRVRQLEHSVEALHQDMGQVKQTLAVVSTQISDGFTSLKTRQENSEVKLDEARTRRPDTRGMAAWAAVVITLVGAIMWPAYQRIENNEEANQSIIKSMSDRGVIMGEFAADRDHLFGELESIRGSVDAMRGDRFTKQDGQILSDKIDRLHEK